MRWAECLYFRTANHCIARCKDSVTFCFYALINYANLGAGYMCLKWVLCTQKFLHLSPSCRVFFTYRISAVHIGFCPVSDLSRRSVRLAGHGDLFVSRANTSIGQRSFSIAAPVVWNALPSDLRSPHISRKQFRSKLKIYLFRQVYTAWFFWERCWRV